jgi:hypothetical protein
LPQAVQQFFAKQSSVALWVIQLQQALACSDNRLALPIVELAIPRLQVLLAQESQQFLTELRRLAWLNQRLSVFEFSLLKLIEQALHKPKVIFKHQALQQFAPQSAQLVATLLQYSAHDVLQYQAYYQQLLTPLFGQHTPPMPSKDVCSLQALDKVLMQFNYLNIEAKKQLINLAADTIQSDGVLHRSEYELLRVLAALLNCPMPLMNGLIKS